MMRWFRRLGVLFLMRSDTFSNFQIFKFSNYGLALDHYRNHPLHRWNTRQLSSTPTRPTHCLCRSVDSTIQRSQSIHCTISLDMGGDRGDHSDTRLHGADLGNETIWRIEVWNMGMHHWIPRCILDGSMGNDHWSFPWRLHRRAHCTKNIQRSDTRRNRFLYLMSFWISP